MDAPTIASATSANHLRGTVVTSPELWEKVLARDPAADGAFVYGVRTTGIFCRPTCPSRRPSPKNVVFFPDAEAALLAGLRPCLRCKPHGAPAPGVSAGVAQAARYLAAHPERATTGRDLARRAGRERLTLLREFRRALGVTPGEFARASRVEHLREDLVAGASVTVTDAIYAAGFGSSSRVYERSHSELGMTPGELRSRADGLVIRYTIVPSPLGLMLVAATEVGVCAILFGEDAPALEADLRRRFRKAQLVPVGATASAVANPTATASESGGSVDDWLASAAAFVASQLTEHPLARSFPLDIRATAFQLRVWKALQAIPRGQTRCYSDVAVAIGTPTSVRAVGAAIGANPLAVVVPCHRVLGKDGSLTGYDWGLDRKRLLLAAERGNGPADERS